MRLWLSTPEEEGGWYAFFFSFIHSLNLSVIEANFYP
jgi:hypothetical protein